MTTDSPQRDTIQESMEAIAYRIADMMINLRGTGESITIDIGDFYIQAASYDANQILIELPSNANIHERSQLNEAKERQMRAWGFRAPDEDFPNWWIGLEEGLDHHILKAAVTVTIALVNVYGTPIDWLARAVGVDDNVEPFLRR